MASNIWPLAKLSALDVAATATLLAIRANRQSLFAATTTTTTEQPDDDSEDSDGSGSEDDDDDDDDDGGEACSTTTGPLTTPAPRDALIDNFLDRLGELFSREKTSSGEHVGGGSSSRQGSKHVAATAWIKPGARHESSSLTVIVAKNEGLDDRDRRMAVRLQTWFRAMAATGRHPSTVLADKIWMDDKGLVEYSRGRLWCHISEIKQPEQSMGMEKLAARSGRHGPAIARLQCLCRDATADSTVRQLSEIVNVAYPLRYVWKDVRDHAEHRKAVRRIDMLGRLRAAYECFTSVALTFDEMAGMEMKPVVSLHQPMEINVTLFREDLQRLAGHFRLPKGFLKSKAAQGYTGASRLYIHAEMQILVSLAKNADWHRRAHRYIGASRKPCFLCNQILQHYDKLSVEGAREPAFKARPSHGKVYPLWTLPQSEIGPCVARLTMATATTHAYHQIQQHLRHGPVLEAAIAESSAGVTGADTISGGCTAMKKQYLVNQRTCHSPGMVEGSGEEPVTLGRKIKSVRVGLLPADGSKPRLIPITFHALPEKRDRRIRECGRESVPDFHDSWGACQFDRRYRILTLENQAVKEAEGDYRLYWNENHELLENEKVKRLLDIKKVPAVRRFWYGDVFVVRYSEHPQTFAYDVHDTPTAIFQNRALELVFREMWESQFLEDELTSDRYHGAVEEKIEADKEILLRRMTPIEQDVLSRMAPGMLEYLAITACDDGAMVDSSVTEDPHEPTMVQINTMMKKTALDALDWAGFDSSHL